MSEKLWASNHGPWSTCGIPPQQQEIRLAKALVRRESSQSAEVADDMNWKSYVRDASISEGRDFRELTNQNQGYWNRPYFMASGILLRRGSWDTSHAYNEPQWGEDGQASHWVGRACHRAFLHPSQREPTLLVSWCWTPDLLRQYASWFVMANLAS